MKRSLFSKLISSDADASSKRFTAIVFVIVFVITHFLLMFVPIRAANHDLIKDSQENLFWLILGFGGLITMEFWKRKDTESKVVEAKNQVPETIVNQDVQNQNVNQNIDKAEG